MKQAIIVGCGISGATAARNLADNGFRVTVIEKLAHVGGNVYDELNENIFVHKYGPHIFHTNYKEVVDFLSRFTEWFDYNHKVLAYVDGQYIPVPFNLEGLEKLYCKEKQDKIRNLLEKEYGFGEKVPILKLKENKDEDLKNFADFVFKKVFLTYTTKQWGRKIEDLDPSIMTRVPVYISYEDKYFTDAYQVQPKNGFTNLINNMLNSEKIEVKLNTEAKTVLSIENNKILYYNKPFKGIVIFTGPIDEFLNNEFGALPYRSLKFKYKKHNKDSFQPSAVVNYTVSKRYTRISEFKKFTTPNPPKGKTIIVKEYSLEYKQGKKLIPYYPVVNQENNEKFKKYENYIKKIKNFYLLGRLGNYKYINMDSAVKLALDLSNKIKENF